MKQIIAICFSLFFAANSTFAQCAMCTKTAQGLDDGTASRVNLAIIYLAIIPLAMIIAVMYYIYRLHKSKP